MHTFLIGTSKHRAQSFTYSPTVQYILHIPPNVKIFNSTVLLSVHEITILAKKNKLLTILLQNKSDRYHPLHEILRKSAF
jgi:hypothetical protein